MAAAKDGALPSKADKAAFQRSTLRIAIPDSLPDDEKDVTVDDLQRLGQETRSSLLYGEKRN